MDIRFWEILIYISCFNCYICDSFFYISFSVIAHKPVFIFVIDLDQPLSVVPIPGDMMSEGVGARSAAGPPCLMSPVWFWLGRSSSILWQPHGLKLHQPNLFRVGAVVPVEQPPLHHPHMPDVAGSRYKKKVVPSMCSN